MQAGTLTRQLLFDKKKKGLPIHPRPLHVSSEKFNFTRVNRYLEERYDNESFASFALYRVELAVRRGDGNAKLFFTVNGERKVRFVKNFFEFNSTPIGGG